MSMSEFNRWLDIAAGDGVISGDEERALIERARALDIDDASATLLIEHRRQRAAAEPPKCPSCRQPLTDAEVTLICPNCKADIGAVRGKNNEAGGIIQLLNRTEDAVTAVASIHIPNAVKTKSPLHGAFVQTLAKADSAVSMLERYYGVNPMVVEMSQAYRAKLSGLETNYRSACKRGRRRLVIPLISGVVLFASALGYYLYSSKAKETRAQFLSAEFRRLIGNKSYDSATAVYLMMRQENVPRAYEERVIVYDGDTTKIPEDHLTLMNGKLEKWLVPIIKKLERYSKGGPYDSCYALMSKLEQEWRDYPSVGKDGAPGEGNTLGIVNRFREITEDDMFLHELHNNDISQALNIVAKVVDSERRRAMLQHALEYLRETNRNDDAAQVSALLRE
jgi:hypothetical protein